VKEASCRASEEVFEDIRRYHETSPIIVGSPELSVMSSRHGPKQANHVPFAHLECMLLLLDRLFSTFERRVRSSIFADHLKIGRAHI
jgi:hypothetical protein